MGREILFRAKHIHTMPENEHLDGRWIYGYLSDENYINSPELEGEFLIDERTVCQYIGLTDKNDKKIFEEDICIIRSESIDEEYGYFVVRWDNERARFILLGKSLIVDFDNYFGYECEVIGNIFDNTEPLKEETQ